MLEVVARRDVGCGNHACFGYDQLVQLRGSREAIFAEVPVEDPYAERQLSAECAISPGTLAVRGHGTATLTFEVESNGNLAPAQSLQAEVAVLETEPIAEARLSQLLASISLLPVGHALRAHVQAAVARVAISEARFLSAEKIIAFELSTQPGLQSALLRELIARRAQTAPLIVGERLHIGYVTRDFEFPDLSLFWKRGSLCVVQAAPDIVRCFDTVTRTWGKARHHTAGGEWSCHEAVRGLPRQCSLEPDQGDNLDAYIDASRIVVADGDKFVVLDTNGSFERFDASGRSTLTPQQAGLQAATSKGSRLLGAGRYTLSATGSGLTFFWANTPEASWYLEGAFDPNDTGGKRTGALASPDGKWVAVTTRPIGARRTELLLLRVRPR
ncbi:MAG: hypothetical protein ACOZIN_02045 [Myxococcota bacterium]